jgi:hypothetical protein
LSSPRCRHLALLALALALAGCAPRSGIAYLEIEDDQGLASGGKAEPVYIDPRVEVVQNEYRRSYINNGSNILQKVRVKGPIMIVPAPPGPATTQPVR